VPVADSHCHLDIADPPEDWLGVDAALAASAAVGVPRIVQIGCDRAGARWAVETAQRYGAVVAGVALHPNEVPGLAATGDLDTAIAEIDALAADPRVRAVGETGLDYFRTGEDGRAVQQDGFRAHI
jgi:TatD DNase family protein